MNLVVSDTSPIRALEWLGLLDLLESLYGKVLIPSAVASELKHSTTQLRFIDITQYPFIQVTNPSSQAMIDSLHLERSGGTIDSLMGVDRHLLPYLQICDAPAILDDLSVAGRLHEALEGRLLPGDGALPIGPLLRAVPEVPLSFEIRSAALRAAYPNPLARARAVAAAASRLND